MKNYFYEDLLLDRIKEMIDVLPHDAAKNITCGDFSVLPMPEELGEYLPAIIIGSSVTEPEFANRVSEILYTPFIFKIHYIFPYSYVAMNDTPKQAKKIVYQVANIFLNNPTLGDLTVERNPTEAGGAVINCMITKIDFNPAENSFFTALEIPASVAEITLEIEFRTYQK